MFRIALVSTTLLLASLMAGCQSPLYRPYANGVGYSDAEVSPGVFEVYYEGTSRMSFGRAKQFARARAAELALQRGATHFRVLDTVNQTRIDVKRSSQSIDRGYDEHGFPLTDSRIESVSVSERPVGILLVEFLDGGDDDAFLAQQVYDDAVAKGIIPIEEE